MQQERMSGLAMLNVHVSRELTPSQVVRTFINEAALKT